MSRQTSLFDYSFSGSGGSGNRRRKSQNQTQAQDQGQDQISARPPASLSPSTSFSSTNANASSHRGRSSRGGGGGGSGRRAGTNGGGRGGGGDRSNPSLAAVAAETRAVLPSILRNLPHLDATLCESLHLSDLPPLRASACPAHASRARIRVVNADSLNAAADLAAAAAAAAAARGSQINNNIANNISNMNINTNTSTNTNINTNTNSRRGQGRVAVLNLASDIHPGGGWLQGAVAQEEALCYRSSLHLSLHARHYPFRRRMGLYTPDVVVIRSDMAGGHGLLVPGTAYADLPVVSVVSIAGIRNPEVRLRQKTSAAAAAATTSRMTLEDEDDDQEEDEEEEEEEFARPSDRTLTMDKMRLCLRMAASRGHDLLVLGALGCGAFHNPPGEVARCWRAVLGEAEFAGGWWREVWFAVYDRRREGNFEVFDEVLGGLEV